MTDTEPTALVHVPASPLAALQDFIARGGEPAQLSQLMDLEERWRKGQAKDAFFADMAAVQEELPPVVKDAENSQTNSKYAKYETVNGIIKPIYTRHGFSISFGEQDCTKPDHIRVFADVRHRAGHVEQYHGDFPLDGVGLKGNRSMTLIHAKGSTFTYARRYLVYMIFNIALANEDNDAAGSLDTLTAEEIAKLESLILTQPDKMPLEKFLDLFQVESIDQVLRKDFPKWVDSLTARRMRKAGGK